MLITGLSGFLGKSLINYISSTNNDLYFISRKKNNNLK